MMSPVTDGQRDSLISRNPGYLGLAHIHRAFVSQQLMVQEMPLKVNTPAQQGQSYNTVEVFLKGSRLQVAFLMIPHLGILNIKPVGSQRYPATQQKERQVATWDKLAELAAL